MIHRFTAFLFYSFIFATTVIVLYEANATTSTNNEWHRRHCGVNGRNCSHNQGKYARHDASCQDSQIHCRDFALKGECIKNEPWMTYHCPQSCGLCVSSKLGDDDATCRDQNSHCSDWAENDLECFVNPSYMSENCAKSCHFCVNATHLRETNEEDEAGIERRFWYSRTDFGIWQKIPPDSPHVQAITDTVRAMDTYSRQLPELGPSVLCSNLHSTCAVWAVEHGCGGPNLEFMLQECALACQSCHVTKQYYQCSLLQEQQQEQVKKIPVFSTGLSSVWHRLQKHHSAENLLSNTGTTNSDEWIASLSYSALWKNKKKSNQMIQSLLEYTKQQLEWSTKQDGSSSSSGDTTTTTITTTPGKRAICQDEENSPCSVWKEAIATLLGISSSSSYSYLEPLELVQYKEFQRQLPQSDFDLHNGWKPAGSTLLTIFIVLQPATKGGYLGFPELDWLFIEAPEILIWPNVADDKDKHWNQELKSMQYEQLPAVEGEVYGVFTRVRQYPYENDSLCEQ